MMIVDSSFVLDGVTMATDPPQSLGQARAADVSQQEAGEAARDQPKE